MKIPLYQVDAFTSNIFEGNPAAVCPLKEWIDEGIMQNIAQENNLSETAFFVRRDNDFEIRWFTPVTELDLAGHPTLACAHVILKELKINLVEIIFKTKIKDTLNVTHKDNKYLMDFPSRDPESDNNIDLVSEALGSRPKELFKHRDAVAVFDSEEEVNCLLYTSPSPRDVEESREPASA